MIYNETIAEIMSTKSNKTYQAWLKDMESGNAHLEPIKNKQDSINRKNLRITKMIDNINLKIKLDLHGLLASEYPLKIKGFTPITNKMYLTEHIKYLEKNNFTEQKIELDKYISNVIKLRDMK